MSSLRCGLISEVHCHLLFIRWQVPNNSCYVGTWIPSLSHQFCHAVLLTMGSFTEIYWALLCLLVGKHLWGNSTFSRNVSYASFTLRGLYSSPCPERQISFLEQQKWGRNSLKISLDILDKKNECGSKQNLRGWGEEMFPTLRKMLSTKLYILFKIYKIIYIYIHMYEIYLVYILFLSCWCYQTCWCIKNKHQHVCWCFISYAYTTHLYILYFCPHLPKLWFQFS